MNLHFDRKAVCFFVVILSVMFVLPSLVLNSEGAGGSTPIDKSIVVGYDVCTHSFCTGAGSNFYTLVVHSSWIVPSIKECASTETSSVTFEAGIDYSSSRSSLENGVGINIYCSFGTSGYAGRVFEAGVTNYLGSSQYPIHAGDHMDTRVSYNGMTAKFTVVLHDSTHLWTYKAGPYADGAAPLFDGLFLMFRSCATDVCQIVNFGTMKTSADYVTVSTGGLGGTKGSLGYWFASPSTSAPSAFVWRFDMTDLGYTNNVMATTSAITSASTGFNFKFVISS